MPDIVVVGVDYAGLSNGTRIPVATVVVTTGMRASPLGAALAGATRDEMGRLHVDRMLRVQGVHAWLGPGCAHDGGGGQGAQAADQRCAHLPTAGRRGRYFGHGDGAATPWRVAMTGAKAWRRRYG